MICRRVTTAVTALLVLVPFGVPRRAETRWTVVAAPGNSFDYWILGNGVPLLPCRNLGWGPKWASVQGATATTKGRGGTLDCQSTVVVDRAAGTSIAVSLHADQPSAQSVRYRYELSST